MGTSQSKYFESDIKVPELCALFFFFFTLCLEITTSSLRSAWKSSIIKPSCLFSIQEPSFCLVWFGLVIWNLIVYLLPIWHHLVWCMTFGSPISCYSLQVWISHALPKPLRALKYPDHAWWEETRVLKTHVDVFICLNDFTGSVSESKTVSIRMEWLIVLNAAWRLRTVRTEKYPMDLAIRKQCVGGLRKT